MTITLTFIETLKYSPFTFDAGEVHTVEFLGMAGDCYRVKFIDVILEIPQMVVSVEWQ